MMAGDFIDESSDMLILYGDTPLITGETLTKLVEVHRTEGHSVTVVSSKIEDPAGYGRIMRDDHGGFERIVEHKDATDTQRMINEINTGIYIFNGRELKESLGKLNNNNAQGEYYLTDCLELILKAEQAARLDAALRALSDCQRRRILAFYLDGESKAKIAKRENVYESAVRKSIRTGLTALKKFLNVE